MSQMTEQMFNDRLKEIEDVYRTSKNNLYREYALLNAKFKVGDIITNGTYTILVQEVDVSKGIGLPEVIYHGIELKNDLTPINNVIFRTVYGDKNTTLLKPHNP